MNSAAMQKPIADERADDPNRRVPDKTKPIAANNLASQPSGDDPNAQNDKQPLVRQMRALPSALRIERRERAKPVRESSQRFFAGARFLSC